MVFDHKEYNFLSIIVQCFQFLHFKGFQIIKQSSGKSGGSSDTPKALAPNLGGHSAIEKCGNTAKHSYTRKVPIPNFKLYLFHSCLHSNLFQCIRICISQI